MGALDQHLLGLSDGAALAVVIAVAALLGLRHAADPDHLVAVAALLVGDRAAGRSPAALGLAWGAGHGLTLVALGAPLILVDGVVPPRVEQAAELAVACVIVALALRLLVRRGPLPHVHVHHHDGTLHGHLHAHAGSHRHVHAHGAPPARTPRAAFALGTLHGIGGSGGAALLMVAAIDSRGLAAAALVLFAACAAVSMAAVTIGLGRAGAAARLGAARPALACVSLAFGVWYGLAALEIVPYPA